MRIPFRRTRLAAALAGAAVALGAPLAQGAGFALQENNASGLGNAYAGGAAVAEDASTRVVEPGRHVAAQATRGRAGDPLHHPVEQVQRRRLGPGARTSRSANNGGDAGGLNVIPNLYVVVPYSQQLAFGLGINVPFGLTTEYDDGWIGRYHGIKSQVKTINVQPDGVVEGQRPVLGRPGRRLPVDRRAAHQRRELLGGDRARRAAGRGGRPDPGRRDPGNPRGDRRPRLAGHGEGRRHRVGLEHRRAVRVQSEHARRRRTTARDSSTTCAATSISTTPRCRRCRPRSRRRSTRSRTASIARLFNGDVHADIELPPIVNVSFFHRINDRWDIMADAQWTGWSTLKDLTFVRNEGPVLATHAGEFRRRVARVGRRELPRERPVDAARRARVRPVAGQRRGPHAAAARLGPRLALVRRPVQALAEPDHRRAASPTSSSTIRRSTRTPAARRSTVCCAATTTRTS